MIRVERQPEPVPPDFDFDGRVRKPGLSALSELSGGPKLIKRRGAKIKAHVEKVEDITPALLRKKAYWTRALPALHRVYRGYCAYASFYIEPLSGPTVDHFVAIQDDTPQGAYEWSNYRLACSLMNALKGTSADIIDPCALPKDAFALDLDTFEVVLGSGFDEAHRDQADRTLRLLNSAECKSMRRRYFDTYWNPDVPGQPIPLWFIEKQAPFLAQEMRRQGRIRADDQEATTHR